APPKLLIDISFLQGGTSVCGGRYLATSPSVWIAANSCQPKPLGVPMDFALAKMPKTQGRRMTGAFTFGIEEEYFLVDAETGLVACEVSPAFFEAAKAATEGRCSTEFLQPQIEV